MRGTPPYSCEYLMLKALAEFADCLEQAAQKIREALSVYEVLEYKDEPVGYVRLFSESVEFVPFSNLTVKVDNSAVDWLRREVLEKIKEKHGFNYEVIADKDGRLSRIMIAGRLEPEKLSEYKEPVAWAFAAASGIIEQPIQIIERAKKMFPNELIDKISLELSGDHVIVKPKQFLGSKLFSELADIARNKLGGEYVSAGRDSHFRIPIEAMRK
ncbi:hypothetical protein J7L00_02465 [Candidatus Bathyarchaeota archaeon]|nr:hypothetical protein [Candidatus Bathyarchaeota archaeon]